MNKLLPVAIVIWLMGAAPISAQHPRADTVVKQAGAPLRPGLGQLVYDGVTIGALEGAPEYTFAQILGLAVGRDGSVYVLDGQIMGGGGTTVRQYDANGKFVRAIGRLGDGPGEYRRPNAIGLLPDGRFLVMSERHRVINVYSRSGAPLSGWPVQARLLGNYDAALTVSPEGIVALQDEPASNPTGQLRASDLIVIIRVRPNGTVLDTLKPPAVPNLAPPLVIKRRQLESGGSSRFGTRLLYFPDGRWFWSPLGYFVTGRTDRYAIDLLQPGRPVLRITRDVPPVPVNDEERADQKSYHQQRLDTAPGEQTGTLGDVPRVKPFFNHIYFDANGRIFVSVATASERFNPPERRGPNGQVRPQLNWRSPTHFDVFEADGTYVGQFAMPYGVSPRFFRGDQVWAVVRDDLDVEYIKRYKIVWK